IRSMQLRAGIRVMGVMVICIVLFYLVPTFIEILIAAIVGDTVACIVWGNITGCAFLAVFHRKIGIGLYLTLALVESLALWTDLVSASTMFWFTDLLPAAALGGIAATMSTAGRFRRETAASYMFAGTSRPILPPNK